MIQLFHVYKAYDQGVPVLRDVTLAVGKGDFLLIKGASGAGKTTLFKLLVLEETVTSGQIYLFDKSLSHLKPSSLPYLRRQVGCIFQDLRLLRHKTVYENVALPLRILGLSRRQINRRVYEMLGAVDLQLAADLFPSHLSWGEQQRVAIARALITRPPLILADEPTSHLDQDRSRMIFALLREINLMGATLLVASHGQDLPWVHPHREVWLEGGRLVEDPFRVKALGLGS